MSTTTRTPRSPANIWSLGKWASKDERQDDGQARRKRVPLATQATFEPVAARAPLAILAAQEADRLKDLIPLRHRRMAESPFAYYRGTAAVMAFDLSTTPRTGIHVQASGDAHISNFGLYASPERNIVFDANDFDETVIAPWEWDLKRLTTSVVVAGRGNGLSASTNRTAVLAAVRSYRERMASFAGMRLIEIWYSRITESDIREAAAARLTGHGHSGSRMAEVDEAFKVARSRDAQRAAAKLTLRENGQIVIKNDPPSIQHVEVPGGEAAMRTVVKDYLLTLNRSTRAFLERYRFSDFALKVVGVGSVGTRCYMIVLLGRDEHDPLILQAKEATASVLEPYVAKSDLANHGDRVVYGQRVMQATSDILLGWCRGAEGRDFYFRQMWDMKGSFDVAALKPVGLGFYAGLCGWSLAAAHARSGDSIAISAYLGSSDTFDGAIADFAETYADQNERDYTTYVAAIASGEVSA